MQTLLPLVVGVLIATSVYLLLQRNLLRQVFGVMLLGAGINLLILTAGRVRRLSPPLVPDGAGVLALPYANPLSQALILTAIVISFGLTVFTLVLVQRTYRALGTVNADDLGEDGDDA